MDTWLGVVEGDWLANAGVLTLTVLAIASAMRSTGFFDGAGAGEHLLVLAVWALAGRAALAWPLRRTLRARWTRSVPQVTGSPTT